jgi:class 3 adenylate cyclase
VLAARKLQERCRAKRDGLTETFGLKGDALGVGIGISSGELSFGEFGRSHRDLTAIGTVVNTASRAQSAAEAGQILVTPTVYERARAEMVGSRAQDYRLKGFDVAIELYAA